MARTTSTAVGGIIEVDADITLTPFIDAANVLVTECCSTDDYTTAELTRIELWLSAHFYTVRDMRAEMEKAGPVSEKKQSKVDLGFNSSHYGQMAMRLDHVGGLAVLNDRILKGKRAGVQIAWLGTADPTDVE